MSVSLIDLPFSQACENNKAPILAVLKRVFAKVERALEIGSGTGQHATYFAEHLPHLIWQPSDQEQYFDALQVRWQSVTLKNLKRPKLLDVRQAEWPVGFDAVFSANTAHIMAWDVVKVTFQQVGSQIAPGGLFALYGPFNYDGKYTSASNRNFDEWLKVKDPQQGIRDIEAVKELAQQNGMVFVEDNPMPANNRLLVWRAGK